LLAALLAGLAALTGLTLSRLLVRLLVLLARLIILLAVLAALAALLAALILILIHKNSPLGFRILDQQTSLTDVPTYMWRSIFDVRPFEVGREKAEPIRMLWPWYANPGEAPWLKKRRRSTNCSTIR
jgi:hypothetical protein